MKLEGAEVKNIYGICSKIGGDAGGPLRLRIPYYQRPYKWTIRHIENLFADFFQNKEDSEEKEYFVGSVVLVKTEKDEFYEVVDGQQRTTTVFLLNYLKFLLQRSYIEELLATQKIAKIPKSVEELCNTLNMLVVLREEDKVPLHDFRDDISGKLDEISEIAEEDEKEKESDKLLEEFRKLFGLPLTKDLSDEEIYARLESEEMETYLDCYDLTLRYDRESYNKLLKEALKTIGIIYSNTHSPQFVITGEVEKDTPLEIYVSALKQEFVCLSERVDQSRKPIEIIENMISDINCMLENLSFCKILTGNEHDAYTLFEVLNDRALAVDDLELVKNMFFKKYCNCSADKDAVKDANIEQLDNLWGETIFGGAGATQTKIISYCGSVYLTGTPELVTNKGQRYRDVLQEKYLSKKKRYEFEDIQHDFQILQAVRMITDKAKLRYQTVYKYALMAENNVNKSVVYKTLNLIKAIDYPGVMPAMINVIIRTYLDDKKEIPMNMKEFDSYLESLMGTEKKSDYQNVYECAELIRKVILLGKDYKIPREIAKNIIEHNYREKSDSSAIKLSVEEQEKLMKEYWAWTKGWRYGSDKQNFRLKILFLDLYRTEKEGDKLKFTVAKYTLSNDIEVALDHLDAQKIDASASEKYFEPEDSTEPREEYVNSLGNMMILDGRNNGDKNNKPLCQALEYHKKLADHWLITEIEEMLNDDKYSKEIKSGIEVCRVAKESFFEERTKRLQRYFLALINRKPGEDKLDVGE